jgi:streptogramin lyase
MIKGDKTMSKRMLISVRVALVLAALFLLAMAPPAVWPSVGPVCYTRILLGSDVSSSLGIIRGPDDNIWVFEQTTLHSYRIARITSNLEITAFPLADTPWRMTAGPDGNIWYTVSNTAALGRVTMAGSATTFPLPANSTSPYGIAAGPDGNLWVTETSSHQILKVGTDGTVVDQFPVPATGFYPSLIVRGPDNNLWFIEAFQKIGRMTTAGVLTEFSFPSAIIDLGAGPDGNIWYDRFGTNPSPYTCDAHYGKITPSGIITEFGIWPCSDGMTVGSDGNLWVNLPSGRGFAIGRFTPAGIFEGMSPFVFVGPDLSYDFGSGPTDITSGADGRIWLSEKLVVSQYDSIGDVATINPQHLDCYYQYLPSANK